MKLNNENNYNYMIAIIIDINENYFSLRFETGTSV